MKLQRIGGGLWKAGLLALAGIGLLVAGCRTEPQYAEFPGASGGGSKPGTANSTNRWDVFVAGDKVTITFTGPDNQPVLPEFQENVKEDGKITPPGINGQSFMAVGKSPGQLQAELQVEYNKFFKNLTVTVLPKERVYYVFGDVQKAGALAYLGETHMTQAIAAAGGFTEYANRRGIRVTHTDGRSQIVNFNKAIRDRKFDVLINPGDTIWVPRSIL